jgi:hypothetical protein
MCQESIKLVFSLKQPLCINHVFVWWGLNQNSCFVLNELYSFSIVNANWLTHHQKNPSLTKVVHVICIMKAKAKTLFS